MYSCVRRERTHMNCDGDSVDSLTGPVQALAQDSGSESTDVMVRTS